MHFRVDDRFEQMFLARVATIESFLSRSYGGSDLLHGGVGVAVLGEQPQRGGQYVAIESLGRLRLGTSGAAPLDSIAWRGVARGHCGMMRQLGPLVDYLNGLMITMSPTSRCGRQRFDCRRQG